MAGTAASLLDDGLSASLSSSCYPVTSTIIVVVAAVVLIVVIVVPTVRPRCRHRDYHCYCARNPRAITSRLSQAGKKCCYNVEISNYWRPDNCTTCRSKFNK